MFKKVSVILFTVLMLGCVSEPSPKGFKGTGDFDTAEAAKTRVSLGLTYLKNGNFSQAKFNLDKALEFAPKSGEANYAMAFYYEQVDEIQRAHNYYKEAIKFSQNDPDILNSYGAFLCKQGDYEQAKKFFLQSVDDKSYISTASTYENLAICSENQGKIEEAIVYFNSALNHQPTRASSLLYLTELYIQTGRWDEAKKSLWKYERNASISAQSLWLSFQIARGQQDLRASVEYVELLKRLYPSNSLTQKAVDMLGKFQPDMTVTQKSRDSAQSNNANLTTSNLGQAPAPKPTENKKIRVLAPPETNQAQSKTEPLSEKIVQNVAPDKVELENTVENDTEQALKIALENVDTLPQNNSETVSSAPNNVDVPAEQEQTELVKENLTEATNEQVLNNTDLPETFFHIVQPKENLYRISVKYNVKIKKLLEWNQLADASSIRIGTKLLVRDPNLNE